MKSTPGNAFLRVYVPTLLCLPEYCRVVTPGIPDPTFSQGVAMVIFAVSMMRGGFQGYRFGHLDIVVLAYAGLVFNSELQASGYPDAQNLMFSMLFSVVAPYFMAKSFIEPAGMRYEFARQAVACLAVVAVLDAWETRCRKVWLTLSLRLRPTPFGFGGVFSFIT